MRRILTVALLLAVLVLPTTAHALAPLTDADKVTLLTTAESVKDAIIARDLVALQGYCDHWEGLWIDAGQLGRDPLPVIYYGWEQIPQMLEDDHLYFLGWADGTGLPVFGRTGEIIWEGRWEVHDVGTGELQQSPWPVQAAPLPELIADNDGWAVDGFTVPPANVLFRWDGVYHYAQYFSAGADGDPAEPFDNQYWFLVFDLSRMSAKPEWKLIGLAHLDGWGI
jgi:hypothetical protein